MSSIKWNPTTQLINNVSNTIVIGSPGQGRKFYLDKNGNKVEDEVEDKVEEDE